MFCMLVQGSLFFLFTIGVQTKFWKRFLSARTLQVEAEDDVEDSEEDVDVLTERERVLNSEAGDDVLQLKNLFKRLAFILGIPKKNTFIYSRYKRNAKQAVDSLTFGVKKSECFGLLGKFEPERNRIFNKQFASVGSSN